MWVKKRQQIKELLRMPKMWENNKSWQIESTMQSLPITTINRKGLQTKNTSIWIVTNVFSVAICFQLPSCTIGHIWSISLTIVSAAKIMNYVFLYLSKQCACISSLQFEIHPSRPWTQLQVTYSTIPFFIFLFDKNWSKKHCDMNLKKHWK